MSIKTRLHLLNHLTKYKLLSFQYYSFQITFVITETRDKERDGEIYLHPFNQ